MPDTLHERPPSGSVLAGVAPGRLPSTAKKTRQRPAQEQWQRQRRKYPAHKQRPEASALQCPPQAGKRIATEVSGLHIGVRPQPVSCRHGEVDASISGEAAANLAQESLLVVNMFHHVEEADGRQ